LSARILPHTTHWVGGASVPKHKVVGVHHYRQAHVPNRLIGLVQVLAAEYGPKGIRANALLAGGTDTPMGRVVADTPEKLAFVAGLHVLKRLAAPEEIARAALHLATDAASFITGAAIPVDGGVSVVRA
jgi:NAD(P)-dependent dehydrogenase (short-subunit alcohol dehydrogenase family)